MHSHIAAGYEFIYQFTNLLIGDLDGKGGIPINISSFGQLLHSSIQSGDFTRKGWMNECNNRIFFTTGVCCWIQSMPTIMRNPCCSLSFLGGDGTDLGVPLKEAVHMPSVWQPDCARSPLIKEGFGRLDRCPISGRTKDGTNASHVRNYLKSLTEYKAIIPPVKDVKSTLTDSNLGHPYVDEVLRWCGMDQAHEEWDPLRVIIRHLGFENSVTGLVTYDMVHVMDKIIDLMDECTISFNHKPDASASTELSRYLDSQSAFLRSRGLGPSFHSLLSWQIKRLQGVRQTTALFIRVIGNVPSDPISDIFQRYNLPYERINYMFKLNYEPFKRNNTQFKRNH